MREEVGVIKYVSVCVNKAKGGANGGKGRRNRDDV